MNRIRVMLSLGLLVAAASLASAGSFGPSAAPASSAACPADMSNCPGGCCPDWCPLPCADAGAATTTAVAR